MPAALLFLNNCFMFCHWPCPFGTTPSRTEWVLLIFSFWRGLFAHFASTLFLFSPSVRFQRLFALLMNCLLISTWTRMSLDSGSLKCSTAAPNQSRLFLCSASVCVYVFTRFYYGKWVFAIFPRSIFCVFPHIFHGFSIDFCFDIVLNLWANPPWQVIEINNPHQKSFCVHISFSRRLHFHFVYRIVWEWL